jgi:hypothetical protein
VNRPAVKMEENIREEVEEEQSCITKIISNDISFSSVNEENNKNVEEEIMETVIELQSEKEKIWSCSFQGLVNASGNATKKKGA